MIFVLIFCLIFSRLSSFISVNSAFVALRQVIPTAPKKRKLSKIETIRLAIGYIQHLYAILSTGEPDRPCEVRNQLNGNENNQRLKKICTFCVTCKQRSPDEESQ